MDRIALVVLAGLALVCATADARFGIAGAITMQGAEKDVTQAITLSHGVYLVTSTGGGGAVTFTVKQGTAPVYVTMFNARNTADLFAVDDGMVKAGPATLEVSGVAAWTVTVTRVEPSGAGAMPLVLTGAEMNAVISKPFKVAAGTLTVAYTYKAAPKGTGTLLVCDLATGKALQTKMMTARKIAGTYTVTVPSAGTFIAMTRFPLASGGGEVKLSQ